MSTLSEHHKTLVNGVGKCSVPMWMCGFPAGFCDEDAYSEQTEADKTYRERMGTQIYVPALACPIHGGITKERYEEQRKLI